MNKIILASGSPRRRELLSQIGIKYEVITSDVSEEIMETDPGKIVMELSERKSRAVADRLNKLKSQDINIVIGADTIVYHNGKILGKPVDTDSAYEMIQSLSGNIHQVYTGVSIICNEKTIQFYEKTDVSVYPMTEDEIQSYIATGEAFDKAGGYGIQGAFAAYVQKIDGDYNNVVGLPIARLYHELRKADML